MDCGGRQERRFFTHTARAFTGLPVKQCLSGGRLPIHMGYSRRVYVLQVGCQSHSGPGNIQLDGDGYREFTFGFLFHGTVDMDADNGVGTH